MSDAASEILILKWREVRDFELPETFMIDTSTGTQYFAETFLGMSISPKVEKSQYLAESDLVFGRKFFSNSPKVFQ